MRATGRLARGIAAGVALALCANATADDQAKCGQVLDEQLKEMWSLTTSQGGPLTFKKLMDRAIECIKSGKCGKAESLVFVAEMMVDERIVTLQRQKTSLLKDFLARARKSNEDVCALSRTLPSVFEQINKLNALQFDRFNEMMAEYLASPGGGSR